MTKIDIISGFLGAGKTTLIKKLLKEAYSGEKVVLIENEFGEIGIDGGFMKEAGIQITEMNSGCICCSLVGDFTEALRKVLKEYSPDRIIIEPSGVGKLSDVSRAVSGVESDDVIINARTVVADASKCKIYMKNFGEFYNNQIENATAIILSRTQNMTAEKLDAAMALIREHNSEAAVVTTSWDSIDGKIILEAMEKGDRDLSANLMEEEEICPECGHHHHHDDDDEEECCCHHHHHDDDDDDDDDEECCCHHHHHHHHGHDADEIFTSWGTNTVRKYSKEEIDAVLTKLDGGEFGAILRAKGIVEGNDGSWIHFDYVPEEKNIRTGAADYTGKICVIGSNLKEELIADLFGVADYERK